MCINKIILAPKLTKLQWDCKKFNMSEKELTKLYTKENIDPAPIVQSHNRQLETISRLIDCFKINEILTEDLTTYHDDCNTLIISAGGDNHFQKVAQTIGNSLILGVNTDPITSAGNLLYFPPLTSLNCNKTLTESWYKLSRSLTEKGRESLNIESWTRLETKINDKKHIYFPRASSEIFIGNSKRYLMSRLLLPHGEQLKCSGIIISTPAGFSGWYGSVIGQGYVKSLPRTAEVARVAVTECFSCRNIEFLDIKPGKPFIISSLINDNGIVSIDCLSDIPFNRGTNVEINISSTPLKVIRGL